MKEKQLNILRYTVLGIGVVVIIMLAITASQVGHDMGVLK